MYLNTRNYRDILREVLAERQSSNPRYSRGAFARDLGLSSGMLSLVLRGQRGLSRSVAAQVADALRLAGDEKELFLSLVESAHSRSPKARAIAQSVMEKFRGDERVRSLQADAFRVISDWYHFGIVELMKLPEFTSDPRWIAEQLSIDGADVEAALERLVNLELVEKIGDVYRVVQDSIFTPDGVPSRALRKFHRQVMEKAIRSLDEQSVDERYLNTTLVAIDERDLPIAQEKIRNFQHDLMKTVGSTPTPSRVYGISVQLFAISQPSKPTPLPPESV